MASNMIINGRLQIAVPPSLTGVVLSAIEKLAPNEQAVVTIRPDNSMPMAA